MKKTDIKPEYLIIAAFIVAKMILYSIANSIAGFDGDEVMHIDAGNHLAFGYMSFQPLIGLMAWVQNLLKSDSLFVHHIFADIASIGIITILGLITLELGGSWKAVLLCLSCYFVAPAFGMSHNAFRPTVFDHLFWTLCFYILVRFCKNPSNTLFVYLAIFAALGFMSKVSIVFFLFGLLVSVILLKPILFKNKMTWIALSLFLILISPNIIWQMKNNYPVVFHLLKLKSEFLNNYGIINNIKSFIITLNPLTVLVCSSGFFIVPFTAKYKYLRLVSFTMFFSFVILAASKGFYEYFYPIALVSFCFGSVYIETLLENRRAILNTYIVLLLVSGIYIIPFGLTVLPIEKYIHFTGLDRKSNQQESTTSRVNMEMNGIKSKIDEERIPIGIEAYYTKPYWEKMVLEIKNIYDSLPEAKKETCLIWGESYLFAGAVNMYGKKYNLPKAFSYHASYYAWTPDFKKGITIILADNSNSIEVAKSRIGYYERFFNDVQLKENIFCKYARDDIFTYIHIFQCNDLKYDSDELKDIFKDRVFNYPPLSMCKEKHILSLFGKFCIACKIKDYKRKLNN